MDAPRFKQLTPFLTARSYQYSFRVVGYGLPSGRFRVLDVIIDLASGEPVVTYLRDLTRLGVPFKLEPEIPIEVTAKSESRNPKSEGRPKTEVRRARARSFTGAHGQVEPSRRGLSATGSSAACHAPFGFLSDLGSRISDFPHYHA